MAGRYIVIEVDSKHDADRVMTALDRWKVARPVAMFFKPDQFCECPDLTRQNASNWAKGKRTGLYLCKRCRKPSVFHQRGVFERLRYVFGSNLLEG